MLEEEQILEGVNDPAIFKAVFLAGGPGSGKSFVVGKTALGPLGFRVVNSDNAYEIKLAQAGMKPTPENIYSPKGQDIRDKAKALTDKKQKLYQKGRLGIVIDGTGRDINKIKKQISQFQKIGYEIAMIFVNTDLDTALLRNRQRARTLPDKQVKDMWLVVQKNIGAFQRMFGRQNFFVVDNSEESNWNQQTTNVYKKISDWSKKPANTIAAKDWIKAQRNMSESLAVGFSTPHRKRSDFRNLILKYLNKKVKSDKSNRQSLRGHILDIKRSVNTDLSMKEIERLYNTMKKRGLTEGKYTDEMRAKLADKIAAHEVEIQKQIDNYKKMTPAERKAHKAEAAKKAEANWKKGKAELATQQQRPLRLRPGQQVLRLRPDQQVPGTGKTVISRPRGTVIFKKPGGSGVEPLEGGEKFGQQGGGGFPKLGGVSRGASAPDLGRGFIKRLLNRESYDRLYEEEAGAAPSNTAASAGIPADTANMGPNKKKKKSKEEEMYKILRRYVPETVDPTATIETGQTGQTKKPISDYQIPWKDGGEGGPSSRLGPRRNRNQFQFNPNAGHRDQSGHPENDGLVPSASSAPKTSPRPWTRSKRFGSGAYDGQRNYFPPAP